MKYPKFWTKVRKRFPLFKVECSKCNLMITRELVWKVSSNDWYFEAGIFGPGGKRKEKISVTYYCTDCFPTKEALWKENS